MNISSTILIILIGSFFNERNKRGLSDNIIRSLYASLKKTCQLQLGIDPELLALLRKEGIVCKARMKTGVKYIHKFYYRNENGELDLSLVESLFDLFPELKTTYSVITRCVAMSEDYYSAATNFIKNIYDEDTDVLYKMLDTFFSFMSDFNSIFTKTYLNTK
ncbi:uncharacterized protein LOC122503812 isoform X1 [Leptopilina heterotoma]|uniref:uncharacterized protein LOC122503812 isoform X1 n=1 Tax=Leptopilina heterotoma TaxID=63436 RepID=UPI001CA97591|nr:uncharacterized protein LOC122503812 isoform X1 [Leptopilina heterotoma]